MENLNIDSLDDQLGIFEFQTAGSQSLEQYYHFGEGKTGACHHQEILKSSWCTIFQKSLKRDWQGYIIPSNYHILQNITLDVKLPSVQSLQDKVYVSWTEDLLHHFCSHISLECADGIIQQWDPVSLNIEYQVFPPRKRKVYSKAIGNQESLILPAKYLPTTNLRLYIPFFFSKSSHSALKIFCLNQKNRESLRLKISPIEDILSLLRYYEKKPGKVIMRTVREKDLGINIAINDSFYQDVIASFKWVTTDEASFCSRYLDIPIPQYISQSFDIPSSQELLVKVPPFPIGALFWVFENIQGTQCGSRSNYTTHYFDLLQGEGPLYKFAILHEKGNKFIDSEENRFSENQPYWFSPGSSERQGYYSAYLSDFSEKYPGKFFIPPSSINLSGGMLYFALKKFLRSSFRLHIRYYTIRHYLIKDGSFTLFPSSDKTFIIPLHQVR